ncbi:MAG: hypothetical protein ACJ72E_10825 [Marmoricola sp.]
MDARGARIEVRWSHGYDAEAVLRDLVTGLTGADPGPVHHRCPSCGSVQHGRPYLDAAVAISISRAGGLTVVAVADQPVGVDVVVGTDTAWARTESLAKAHGTGIVTEHDHGATGTWVCDLALPPGFAGAVATLSGAREVRATAWTPASR